MLYIYYLLLLCMGINTCMFPAESPRKAKSEWGYIIDKDQRVLYWAQIGLHCNLHELMYKFRELEEDHPGATIKIERLSNQSKEELAHTSCDGSSNRLGSFLKSLTKW